MSDAKSTQIKKLLALLPDIIESAGYSELYGYDLLTIADLEKGTSIRDRFLDKFLVANNYDVQLASQQLKDTLAWRKKFNPLSAGFLEKHDDKLRQIGVITSVPITPKAAEKIFTPSFQEDAISEDSSVVGLPEADSSEPATAQNADGDEEQSGETTTATSTNNTASEAEEAEVPAAVAAAAASDNLVVTWNLYGRVPNRAEVFGNLDAFLRYRVGLMEQGLAALDFTKPETSYMAQVHDYNNVSFLRLDAPTKAASKATIDIFTKYYPELLNVKFFVNVPRIMSWMFSFTRMFLPKATLDKFHVVSDGHDLALQTGNVWVPLEYGGNAESLEAIALDDIEPRNPELVTKYDPTTKSAPTPTKITAAATTTATDTTEDDADKTEEVAAPEPGAVPEPITDNKEEDAEEESVVPASVAAAEPGAVPVAKEPIETEDVAKETASKVTEEAEAPEVTEAPTVTQAVESSTGVAEVETAAAKEVETKTTAVSEPEASTATPTAPVA